MILQKFLEKVIYGFGFGLGMGASWKLMRQPDENRASLDNKTEK